MNRATGPAARRLGRLAVLVAMLLATGCVPPRTRGDPAGQPAATATAENLPAGTTIARIQARGVLRVGIRFDREPFGFVTAEGDLAGFDVDLARALAGGWLGDPDRVDFFQITPRTAASKLGGEGVDLLLGALPRDRGLETVADFAQPYYVGGPAFLLRAGEQLETFDDLSDRVVAVGEGEASAQLVTGLAAERGISVTVVSFITRTVALAALADGSVFALLGDSVQLAADAQQNEGLALAPVRFWPSFSAPAVAQGDPVFRNVVDFSLQALKADGSFDRLYARWFPGDVPPALDAWPGAAPYDFASAPELAPGARSAVDRLRAGQPLRVGILADQPGWSQLLPDGSAQGFAVDLINALHQRWISPTATAEFVALPPGAGPAALAGGEIDLLAVPLTPEARWLEQADLSLAYFQDGQAFLSGVRRPVGSLETLDGLTVAAPDARAGDVLRQALAGRPLTVTIDVYAGPEAALAVWDADAANVVTGDLTVLAALAAGRADLAVAGPQLTRAPALVFGLPLGDGRLRDLVNFTLQALAEDGEYAALYARWYGTAPPFPVELWPGTPGDLGVNIRSAPQPGAPQPGAP
jgi:ABC-type amino acid transport substrate-binding protein